MGIKLVDKDTNQLKISMRKLISLVQPIKFFIRLLKHNFN